MTQTRRKTVDHVVHLLLASVRLLRISIRLLHASVGLIVRDARGVTTVAVNAGGRRYLLDLYSVTERQNLKKQPLPVLQMTGRVYR